MRANRSAVTRFPPLHLPHTYFSPNSSDTEFMKYLFFLLKFYLEKSDPEGKTDFEKVYTLYP